eukprot:COSAG01_NODE_2391_length_7773_cov_102.532056_6_plen_48_part_00
MPNGEIVYETPEEFKARMAARDEKLQQRRKRVSINSWNSYHCHSACS